MRSAVLIRRDLRDAVEEGIRRYSGCRWLLTSRIVGYDNVPFDISSVEGEGKAGGTASGYSHERLDDMIDRSNSMLPDAPIKGAA